jgi:hypothetical protein
MSPGLPDALGGKCKAMQGFTHEGHAKKRNIPYL